MVEERDGKCARGVEIWNLPRASRSLSAPAEGLQRMQFKICLMPRLPAAGSPSYVSCRRTPNPKISVRLRYYTTILQWVIMHSLPFIRGVQRLSPTTSIHLTNHPPNHPSILPCVTSFLSFSRAIFSKNYLLPICPFLPGHDRMPQRKTFPRSTRGSSRDFLCFSTLVGFGGYRTIVECNLAGFFSS